MTEMKTAPESEDHVAPVREGEEISPEHRAWMDGEIKTTLEKKKRGEMNFHDVDAVLEELGFDAR